MNPVLCAFLATLIAGSAFADLAGSKPNMILVITDDQGYGPIGGHGHPWIRTPNLDTLHDKSTRFTHFLVSPTCAPTRAALMTGRHPMKNGVTHTILERERLTLDAITLPQVLKAAGYTSAIFGKWHLGDEEPYQPHHRGFDEAFIHGAGGIGQAYDCSCADVPGNTYFDPVIRHNGSFVKTRGYCTDIFFTAALGWIESVKDDKAPFFAYISLNAPHGPFIAPETNASRFTGLGFTERAAGFYGMIENIDENMGRLMAKLQQWDLQENTLLVFMSDNGMTSRGGGTPNETLAPGYRSYNAGMKGTKGSADEGGVRVPFFLRWDGTLDAGRDIDTLAAHIDILPTFATLAGAPYPRAQVEGRDLTPLLTQGSQANWFDRYLFTHKGRWATGANPDDFKWVDFAVRNQRFRLVGEDRLYDLLTDPGQTVNVIGEHPEIARAMRTAYEQFWAEARPLMVNEAAPMSPTRPFHVGYERQKAAGGIPDWIPPRL